MSLLHAPQVSSWLRGHLLCRLDGIHDRFALTFDDGPSLTDTPRVLDALESFGARATFFMLRRPVLRQAALVREIRAAGHETAAHGDLHLPLLALPPPLLAREIVAAADALEQVTGERPRHFRPPFGLMLPSQAAFARRLGLDPVLGDVYPEDAYRPGVERLMRRVTARLRGGSILILHDGSAWTDQDRSQTVALLGRLLPWAAERGLRAVSVAELLDGDRGALGPARRAG
jgi:peptidoglycan/xylan/chitin deacetylase (PgdA/CDA1 family)